MEQTKDYSLLRPFDLEAAKAGAPLFEIYMHRSKVKTDEEISTYIAGPNNLNEYVISYPTNGYMTYTDSIKDVRMAPLAWVEGKPVYKGDVLYQYYVQDHKNRLVTISDTFTNGIGNYLTFTEGGNWAMDGNVSKLTWNKPKVKKSGWMNCYKHSENSVHPTKTRADLYAISSRTACIEIFWEE